MNAIVSVDQNWGIGNQGNLLQRVPEDMAFFKSMTIGHVVIMGRETMLSLPRQEPLIDRVNLVLSRSLPRHQQEGTERGFCVCSSVEDVLKELARCDKDYRGLKKFVIGGEAIYRQFLPYCHTAYVTKFARTYDADRYFPNLDEELAWRLVEESGARYHDGLEFRFTTYRRQS
ncbi:MAG: dihydrofolate reductase [Gracilibacteraceae bacterium]|jgi:dihydrofolate reductase|nr:dihydrofolate reductase [Gracilibacteraceae bacterium]